MKSLAQARVKRVRAVQLLIEGRNYDEIARAVGYSHRGSAHHAVATALAAREVEAVDELRALELADDVSRAPLSTFRSMGPGPEPGNRSLEPRYPSSA